jgi:predicted O-methyltransferase YrrM
MIAKARAVVGGLLHRQRAKRALRNVLRTPASGENALEDWARSLYAPDGYYLECVRVFHSARFPSRLKAHRDFFQIAGRGFGEDAFHVMWWLLFRRLRPERFLEIGVYRGQSLSLAALLQRELGIDGTVTGISPFLPSGDAVSSYREDVDYLADTKANFAHFELPEPELVRAFSTDEAAVERMQREAWDAIYIDGNHDYEVAKADWTLCASCVRPGGVIVLDDSALGTDYHPPAFATAGHPGPSQVAREVDPAMFREILRVGHNRVFQRIV